MTWLAGMSVVASSLLSSALRDRVWFGCGGEQEAHAYATEHGLHFLETSAKSAQNVNEIFYEIGGCGGSGFVVCVEGRSFFNH